MIAYVVISIVCFENSVLPTNLIINFLPKIENESRINFIEQLFIKMEF